MELKRRSKYRFLGSHQDGAYHQVAAAFKGLLRSRTPQALTADGVTEREIRRGDYEPVSVDQMRREAGILEVQETDLPVVQREQRSEREAVETV